MELSSDKQKLREAGIAFSLAALAFLVLSALLLVAVSGIENVGEQDWYRYLCFLMPQIGLAAVEAFWMFRSKTKPRVLARGCKFRYFPIAVLLQFGLMFSLSEVNVYFVGFLEKLGYRPLGSTIPSLEGWNLLPAMIVIAVLPAVFEETLFRGVLTQSMRDGGWGTAATVLIAGAMFSLFHMSPEQTLYQFACGVCFALVAVRSGSVLPTMIAHFLNNAAILVATACGVNSFAEALPQGWYIALCSLAAVCLAATTLYLILDRKNGRRGGAKGGGAFFLTASVGIFICAIQWIAVLIQGFTA